MPDTDLLTYSFPCQDLSTGGLTKGMKKGSGTRSGLLWEIANISTYCKTKVCWERLQSIPFTFSENISGSLITDEDRTINMTRAKKEQRNTSRIDYAIEIFKKGEQYWQNLIDKASEQRACNYHDIELLEAAKKSTKTGRIVSDKQSAVIEKIVEELKKVGIE